MGNGFATYLLIGESLGAINDGDVLVIVYGVCFFLDRCHVFFGHLVLSSVRVDACDEEATPVILHVVHVASASAGRGVVLSICALRC